MTTTHTDPHTLTAEDFASLGVGHVAYIRPAISEGEACFAIMSGAGEPLATADDMDGAREALEHFDLMAVSLH